MAIRILTLVCSLLFLGGCATAYQSKGMTGGFTEAKLDKNIWRVAFNGNGYTSPEQAKDFALLRSAEIALANGFSHFVWADPEASSRIVASTSSTTSYSSSVTAKLGPSAADMAASRAYGGQTTTRYVQPPVVNIVMMYAGKPDLPGLVYDAQSICSSLGAAHRIVCNAPKT